MARTRLIHPIVKWIFTLYLLILIPSYWIVYGPENFLWISDVALFFLYVAVIFEAKVFASMAIVGDILYAIAWVIDFFYNLLSPSLGITKYMSDPTLPLGIRGLSLFHLILPLLMVWVIRRLGYASRAWRYQIVVSTALLFLTWLVSSPQQNINFAFGYRYLEWKPLPFLILMSLANGALIFLTHITIKWAIKKRLL